LSPPYIASVNALLRVGAASGLASRFANDGDGFAIECDARTQLGGSVVRSADGSFVYTPPYAKTDNDILTARARGPTGLASAPLSVALLISGDPPGVCAGDRGWMLCARLAAVGAVVLSAQMSLATHGLVSCRVRASVRVCVHVCVRV
jgi:hypothetical protein